MKGRLHLPTEAARMNERPFEFADEAARRNERSDTFADDAARINKHTDKVADGLDEMDGGSTGNAGKDN